MVTIINYKKRKKEDGSSFFVLELQSGIEFLLSNTTGQYYATAKKCNIATTFDEAVCKGLVGTQMEGNIVKESTTSYEYTIQETGEQITLSHRFKFVPEEALLSPASL